MHPEGYFITSNTGKCMPIFRGRKFYVNQYLGSVNYNMDKNSISRVHKSEKKEELWDLVLESKLLDSIFWVPKTLASIFGGQQGNGGMDPPSPY